MRRFAIIPVLAASVFVFQQCGDPAEQLKTTKKQERVDIVLAEEDIFQGNKIMAFLGNDVKFVQEANELFLQGLGAFRNDRKLDSAEVYFKKSILKEPTAKAYFELGNVYMDQKDYESALSSYGIAEQLNYEPFSKILYNKSCIYSLQENPVLSGKYLEYALQAGYNNLDHINKDEDLENLRKSYHYEQAVDKGLRGMSNAENLFWLQFKKLFPTTDLPLKLETEMSPEMADAMEFISYDYEKYISEMRDEKFSREVSKGFYYFARPYENENFVAIVYVVKDEFMGDFAPLTYMLATFTHEGILIDKEAIGGRSSLSDPILSATLNKKMTIDVDLIEPVYEQDPYEYGYYDNEMVSSKVVGSMKFKITPKGKILTEEEGDLVAN